ncbi:MAG: hypothetical protein DKINENOH_01668 [bacterium]|nr:hypothetical protein [bacterium]
MPSLIPVVHLSLGGSHVLRACLRWAGRSEVVKSFEIGNCLLCVFFAGLAATNFLWQQLDVLLNHALSQTRALTYLVEIGETVMREPPDAMTVANMAIAGFVAVVRLHRDCRREIIGEIERGDVREGTGEIEGCCVWAKAYRCLFESPGHSSGPRHPRHRRAARQPLGIADTSSTLQNAGSTARLLS